MRPICASAHFTGIGFASTNSSRCKALKRSSSRCASLPSPASAAATISDIVRGATLAVTEITPRAPAAMLARAVASSPLRTTKSLPQPSMSSRTRGACPAAARGARRAGGPGPGTPAHAPAPRRGRGGGGAGGGTSSTAATVEGVGWLSALPIDGLLLVPPAYNRPTQEGLYLHFAAAAAAARKPVLLYNVPARTAVDMNPATVARLSKVAGIVGVKEAAPQAPREIGRAHV